jgi:hypothetical protein
MHQTLLERKFGSLEMFHDPFFHLRLGQDAPVRVGEHKHSCVYPKSARIHVRSSDLNSTYMRVKLVQVSMADDQTSSRGP